jgi:hypothetical protein
MHEAALCSTYLLLAGRCKVEECRLQALPIYTYPKKFSDLCLLLAVDIEIQVRSLITHGKKNGEPEVQAHHQEIPSFV